MYHPFAFIKQDIGFTPSITSSYIDVLVVGGGGAGGYRTGGGGGAGGYISSVGMSGGGQSAVSVFTASMNTAYYIQIGAGGNAFNTDAPSGVTGNGSPSRLNDYYANGGGRGGSGYNVVTDQAIYRNGQPGGSGGGGGSWQYSGNYATGSGGTGSSGITPEQTIYGYNGGSGSIASNGTFRRGGGGGGAGAVGEDALTGNSYLLDGARGGDGIDNGPEQTLIYRAGGGGGGQATIPTAPYTASYGGIGGGGNGGTGTFPAGNGIDTTGGGGGGGGPTVGGKGGSGVVILRYIANDITASVGVGVTVSEVQIGVYKVLTVTAGGTPNTLDNITFTPLR